MNSKTCILVLGMHRSGTSAFTKLLSLLGVALPKTLLQSPDGNETGHWESQKIVDFNDGFLTTHNSVWSDWTALDIDHMNTKQRTEFCQGVGKILRSEYKDAPFIVVKDPRICRFAELFAQAVEQAGYTVKCVNVIRNPLEVNASLTRRNAMSDVHANLLWLRHVLDGEYFSRSYDRSFISYDGLLEDYKSCLEQVETDLDVLWPNSLESIAQDVKGFLKSKHRHHNRSVEDVLLHPVLRNLIGECYTIMGRVETGILSVEDKRALDDIRENLHHFTPILRDLLAKIEQSRQLNAEYKVDFDVWHKFRADLQDSISVLQKREKSLSIQRDHAQSDAAKLTKAIVRKDKARAKLQVQVEKQAIQFEKQAIQFSNLQNDLHEVEAVSRKYKKQRDAKQRLVRQHKAALEVKHGQVWELEQKLQNEIEHNVYKQNHLNEVLNSTSWKMMALPRKLIQIWRHKTPFLIALLAGKSVRAQFKDADNISEMAQNARSKATVAARHDLAKNRDQVLGADWYQAACGHKSLVDKDLPNITISAVTYNSQKWLDGFFTSVEALDYPLDKISIHFVDNGSRDDTVNLLEGFIGRGVEKFNQLKLFQRPNEGYGAGNDYGIRQSKDEFVLVTNVDTEFYPDSLRKVVTVAVHDGEKTACWEYRQTPYEHPKYYDPVTMLTNWSSHACVLMRRKAYLAVGGYEKRIFMYGEDVELSYRFRAYGWNLRYVPGAVLKHYVDLEDHTLRPHQLSGSVSANVLLRYRYGSYVDILAGEAFLRAVKRNEVDPVRMQAWDEAIRIVKTHRWYFFRKRKFIGRRHFPFHEFDYDVTRPGATVVHAPFKPDEIKNLPLISVVTRTHGKAQHHLQNAVASVLAQTYKNIELIVVEDRTDDAQEYVEGLQAIYGDKIRYFKSTDGGRSACGNYGAAQARGQYLCWLDNDDMFFADHIETLVRALERDPKAVCSYALAWDALSKMEAGVPVELSYQLPDAHCQPYDKQRLLNENFIPIQSIIFSKEVFKKYGGFNVEFSQLEDWNLWVRYAQAGPFVYTPKVTSLYRTPHNEGERQHRHTVLHGAYEAVRKTNLEDITKLGKRGRRAKK